MDDTSRPSNDTPSSAANTQPVKFTLPEDVDALARMRDRLAAYLETLERNTKTLSDWMNANKETIVLGYHRLNGALGGKDEVAAISAVTQLGPAAGFVLTIGDFSNRVKTTFGENSAVAKHIAKFTSPYPPGVLEDLPEVSDKNANFLSPDVPDAPEIERPKPAEKKKSSGGIWSFVKGAFDDPAAEAAEAQRLAEEKMEKWRKVRDDMIGLTSNKHYYVDAVMDYIGQALDETTPPDVDTEIMLAYKHPQFIIDRATEDFDAVNMNKSAGIRATAARYAKIASLFEKKESVPAMLDAMERLHTGVNESQEAFMRKVLFKDMGIASFSDYALNHVTDAAVQFSLLKKAVALEKTLALKYALPVKEIFEKVLTRVTDAKDPLDPEALAIVQDGLGIGSPADIVRQKIDIGDAMLRLMQRYDEDKAVTALNHLVSPGLGGVNISGQIATFIGLKAAFDKNDAATVASIFSAGTPPDVKTIKSLWKLCFADETDSILQNVSSMAHALPRFSALGAIQNGITGGWFDELHLTNKSSSQQIDAVLGFFGDHFLSGSMDLPTARLFLTTAIKDTGAIELRQRLSGQENGMTNWLERVLSNPGITAADKLSWTALLLKPLKNDYERANTLYAASLKAGDPAVRHALLRMERSFFGDNVPVGDKTVANIRDAACVKAERPIEANKKGMNINLIFGSKQHTLAEGLSEAEAREALAVIARRGPFIPGHDSLLNPLKVDKIIFKDREPAKDGPKVRDTGVAFVCGRTHECEFKIPRDNHDINNLNTTHRQFIIVESDGPRKKDAADGSKTRNSDRTAINIDAIAVIKKLDANKAQTPEEAEEDRRAGITDYTMIMDILGDFVQAKGKLTGQLPQAGVVQISDGTYVNIRNASMISIDEEKGTIGVRIESEEFKNCLKGYFESDDAFLEFDATPRAIKEIRRAIEDNNKYAAHLDNSVTPRKEIYFNFERLGHMMLGQNDNGDYGFSVSVAGEYEKTAFVPARNKEAAIKIFKSCASAPALVRIDQTVLEPSSILQAFYNYNQDSLCLVTSHGQHTFVNVKPRDGLYVLNELCTKLGFIPAQTVPANTVSGLAVAEAINPHLVAAVSSSRQRDTTEICSQSVLISTGMSQGDVAAWLKNLAEQGRDSCGLDAAVRRIGAAPVMRADMLVDADDALSLLTHIQSSATVRKDAPAATGTANNNIKNIKNAFNKATKEALEQAPNKKNIRKGPSFRP
jgi:hypothetical protein